MVKKGKAVYFLGVGEPLEDREYPAMMPAYGLLLTDTEQNLWVQDYVGPDDEHSTWTVFDNGDRSWLGPLVHLADIRSRVARHPYGDQGIFVRRRTFEALGGYPEQPLMEDLNTLWTPG